MLITFIRVQEQVQGCHSIMIHIAQKDMQLHGFHHMQRTKLND